MNRETSLQADQFSSKDSSNRVPVDAIDEKVMSLMDALYSARITSDEFIQVCHTSFPDL